jgi:PPM family protein phosphatase
MKFSVFQTSAKGGRANNEDRMGYAYTRDSGFFVVADGMGGHPEGEVAAQITLQVMTALYQQAAKLPINDPPTFLSEALLSAHRHILKYSNERGMSDAPRTTVIAAMLQGSRVYWIHCGDSRLYLVREGELVVRTRDHSFAEQQAGGLMPSAAKDKQNRHVLFTCLGSPTEPIFDVAGPVKLRQGDKLLLCSDGLWGSLSEAEIVLGLAVKPVEAAVPELVERAVQKAGAGGDNVTVIALEWETPDEPSSDSPATTPMKHRETMFTTTMQAYDREVHKDADMNDADIERSIAEINEAIQRKAARRRIGK